MGQIREVTVPDIGDFKDVPIIEMAVKVGDRVKAEAPLITLESDKASMEVPSPSAGLVKSLAVKVGDKVSQGAPILTLEVDDAGAADQPVKPAVTPPPAPATAPSGVAEVRVPDIGDFKDVPIIEIAVKPGDAVKPEQPLITLESDKASMEVPSPFGGTVAEIKVKIGDRVSEGAVILTLTTEPGSAAPLEKIAAPPPAAARSATATPAAPTVSATPAKAPLDAAFDIPYAGPSVRKLARERAIDLHQVKGSGRRGRILPEDVMNFSAAPAPAAAVSGPPAQGGGLGLLPWPKVDFAKFGPIETKPLSRIKKISGPTLHRNWVMIPHVTNHDECDITELEEFRKRLNKENEKSGVRVSMLAFMIKAAVASLKRFPEFNASLEGDNLILKKYYHIGFAADTPQGLVVPVIRDADKGRYRHRQGDGRSLQACARRQAQARPDAGRQFHDLQPRRYRRNLFHADYQRTGGCHHGRLPFLREAGLGRQAVCAATLSAVVAVVGSPRHRRGRRGALQCLLRKPPYRHAARPRGMKWPSYR
jgi:pyruvate dehydrogenase E2 component (dihydrolipoamide acetyltransferase)